MEKLNQRELLAKAADVLEFIDGLGIKNQNEGTKIEFTLVIKIDRLDEIMHFIKVVEHPFNFSEEGK